MATARSQPKPKPVVANPFGTFDVPHVETIDRSCSIHSGVMMGARQRPTLISATQAAGFRTATAFTTGLTVPGGYTSVKLLDFFMEPHLQCSCCRIYPDQLANLGGLAAYSIAAQPQSGIRYITTSAPHGLTAAGQQHGGYTIGCVPSNSRSFYIVCFHSSVLPMGNGVGAPTGYIINGPPNGNMNSTTAQFG